jgi:hypothetical protein
MFRSHVAIMMERDAVYAARSPDQPKHLNRGVLERLPRIWRGGKQYVVKQDGKLQAIL